MPVEVAKEAAKIVVETSGPAGWIWQFIHWILLCLSGGCIWVWGHITGRIKKLETESVTITTLETHTKTEESKFDNLFNEVRAIGKAVARIEGKLEQ